jgi:hypothetical protein
LYAKFKKEHPEVAIGRSTFDKIKPFYVRQCTPGDIETCCCRIHINFHNAVDALLKPLKTNNLELIFKRDGESANALSKYSDFMCFLYKDCSRDDNGILSESCESECGHWLANFHIIKQIAKSSKQSSVMSTTPLQVELTIPIDLESEALSSPAVPSESSTTLVSPSATATPSATSTHSVVTAETNTPGIGSSTTATPNSSAYHEKVVGPTAIKFQRFEYGDSGHGRRLMLNNNPVTLIELLEYIEEKLPNFVHHSNARFRDVLFWKSWLATIVVPATLIYIDFSENLSMPIHKEPQSMYWIRKQLTIHSGISIFPDNDTQRKVYFGHISEDRDHDQVFVIKCLEDITSISPQTENIIIRSDNASNFKSAESFSDLQELCDSRQSTVVRVYGTPGHGKGEIDSCGGHIKNPIREGIARGIAIHGGSDAVSYLQSKLQDKCNPEYHVKLIEPDELESEREKRLYSDYKTVSGSDKFHVVVFRPGKTHFYASPKLCVCDKCMSSNFENCSNFVRYEPQVGKMSEKATRSKNMAIDDSDLATGLAHVITKGTIFAVRAENAISNYFLLMCEDEEKEHSELEPFVDEGGHAICLGQRYLVGKYLDPSNSTDKHHEFRVLRKKIAVLGATVFMPVVPILSISKNGLTIKISNEFIHQLLCRSSK